MILDLHQFEDFPAEVSIEAKANEIEAFRDDVLGIDRVEVHLAIQKAGEEYFCQGSVAGRVRMECARCLGEFSAELTGGADFIVRSEITGDSNRAEIYDDEDYVFFRGNDLRADITDIVKQTLVLATPMKPICSEDCKGLCPVCGCNRNEKSCTCGQDRIDSRWEGLADLTDNR
ncbi:MAG: DUF177 domain-containing protein [Candidatus Zixiibacteriota bacterium]|jgi:uncharacterized protein